MFPMQTKLPRIAFVAIFGGLAAFPTCAQSLQERMSTCFNCHGEKGQSQRPEVPSLGAQPALYTLIELVMSRDQLRVTEPMNEMTKGLRACLKSPGLQSSPAKDRFRVRHRPFSSGGGKGSNCPKAAARNLHRYRLSWVRSGRQGIAK